MDVRLVTSFPEFERLYGGVIDTNISFLPLAVRGFFENGGRRAFFARAYSPDTGQADLGTAAIGDLTLTAIGPGDWPQRVRNWVEENEPTGQNDNRPEDHTSELQSLIRISYAVLFLSKTTTSYDY